MRLYALDCGSICGWIFHRSKAADGDPVHDLDSFFWEWREKLNPSFAVACFDAGNNFRKVIDPTYKSKRPPKEEAFIAMLQAAPGVVASHGIASARLDTFEADDLVASIATQLASPDCEVIVMSEDKDIYCLIGDHVRQYCPSAGVFVDEAAALAKFKVPCWRMHDYLAMAGDSSDCIAGIVGVGAATAVAAINQTHSTVGIFRRAKAGTLEFAKSAPRWNKLIADGEPQYWHARKLVDMRCDLPVAEIEDYRLREFSRTSAGASVQVSPALTSEATNG